MWALGFVAGVAVGCYLTLSCQPTRAQSAEVAEAIEHAGAEYGVSPAWLRRITWCESRYLPWVTSRGGHMGIAQFSARTWQFMSWQAGYGGASPYDAWSAVHVLAWALRNGYAWAWACA